MNQTVENDPLFQIAKHEKRAYEAIFNDISKAFGLFGDGFKSFTIGQHFFNREQNRTLDSNSQVSTSEPLLLIENASAALAHFVAPIDENSISLNPLRQVLTPKEDTGQRDAFFEDAGRVLQKIIMNPALGFHAHLKEAIKQLLLFGNTSLMVNADRPLEPLFQTIDFREIFVYHDDKGRLKKLWRQYSSRGARDPNSKRTQVYALLHEDEDFNPLKGDKLVSYQLLDESGAMLEEGELPYWPIVFTRLNESPGFQYGDGFGLLMLPHVQQLNLLKKMNLNAGHLMVQPPLQMVASNMISTNLRTLQDKRFSFGDLRGNNSVAKACNIEEFVLNPGQVVAVQSPEPTITPILQSADLKPYMLAQEQESMKLREMARSDILLLSDLSSNASIEEVTEKVSRKMSLLSPIVSSVEKVLNGVVFNVLLNILSSKERALLTSRGEISSSILPLSVQYNNQFTKLPALKKSRQLSELAFKLGNLAQIDPAFVDAVNMDKLVKDMLNLEGYGYLLDDEDTIEAKRQQRQQLQNIGE